MNKDIKQLAEETLDSISKVNGFSDFGGIVLDYDLHYTTIATLKDVITVAMVEMYTAGAGEATCSLPLAPRDQWKRGRVERWRTSAFLGGCGLDAL
jgi:hypothetical protein